MGVAGELHNGEDCPLIRLGSIKYGDGDEDEEQGECGNDDSGGDDGNDDSGGDDGNDDSGGDDGNDDSGGDDGNDDSGGDDGNDDSGGGGELRYKLPNGTQPFAVSHKSSSTVGIVLGRITTPSQGQR
eukprot:CAMPEP_0113848528 /NCGR_PEP_ID=MMETSP0372-20130328/2538_1 /TAXON_ID=340204 /ORGANISM="Lankesteria abbotti" /LENGTH=127 /DNA_ID=CAMNT_0000818043 /DNA_START=1077 /DNA_END=1460 /DNA_ORIENTATION=- /assembly_acc=CAM_ASM_000359